MCDPRRYFSFPDIFLYVWNDRLLHLTPKTVEYGGKNLGLEVRGTLFFHVHIGVISGKLHNTSEFYFTEL